MITAQDIIDNEPRFKVRLCPHGTSRDIEKGIWQGQHICVAEGFTLADSPPSNPGDAVVRHQLKVEHYSVLNFGFVVLHCQGFPHSTMTQISRHRDQAILVQSGRYTGQRFIDVAEGESDVESAFFFRPVGMYQDRQGKRYEYTAEDLAGDRVWCKQGCDRYAAKIAAGHSEEHARSSSISYEFRQNFSIAGTVEAMFHWLDQRSKKDSQIEIQALARLAMNELHTACPTLAQWYEENRYGRARLAP